MHSVKSRHTHSENNIVVYSRQYEWYYFVLLSHPFNFIICICSKMNESREIPCTYTSVYRIAHNCVTVFNYETLSFLCGRIPSRCQLRGVNSVVVSAPLKHPFHLNNFQFARCQIKIKLMPNEETLFLFQRAVRSLSVSKSPYWTFRG